MNILHLRYFLAVAEVGNFTRAAERVFVAQPTLSGAIRRLEEELGTRLIDRAGRRATLTPEGERFAIRAATILAEWQAARTETAAPAEASGRVAIAVARSVASAPVAAMLAEFRARTGAGLRLLEGDDAQVRTWLARGRAELAVQPASRGGTLLYRDRIVCALPAQHPLTRKPSLRPSDLDRQPLVVWTGLDTVPELRRRLDREGVRPAVVARPRDATTAMSFVAAGLGLCLIPDSFRHPGIVHAPVAGLDLARRVVLLQADDLTDGAATLARAAQSWPWRAKSGSEQLAIAH